jgi:hypothetical protein
VFCVLRERERGGQREREREEGAVLSEVVCLTTLIIKKVI